MARTPSSAATGTPDSDDINSSESAPTTTTTSENTTTAPGGDTPQTPQQQQQQRPKQNLGLHSLPPELHSLISTQLIYPDALSLKHTCRYFYRTVDTGIRLKVDWLVERRSLHLECPNDRRCDLGSDLKFCRGSVPLLMQRRREHMECESRPGLGCLVYSTSVCQHRGRKKRAGIHGMMMHGGWLRARLTVEVWWVLVAVLVAAVAWGIVAASGEGRLLPAVTSPGFSFLGSDW